MQVPEHIEQEIQEEEYEETPEYDITAELRFIVREDDPRRALEAIRDLMREVTEFCDRRANGEFIHRVSDPDNIERYYSIKEADYYYS